MKKQIKKYLPLFEYIHFLPEEQKTPEILKLKNDIYSFFLNFLYNVYKKVIPISDTLVKKLEPYKDQIKKIVQKNKSVKFRKNILKENNLFFVLISLFLPILRGLTRQPALPVESRVEKSSQDLVVPDKENE